VKIKEADGNCVHAMGRYLRNRPHANLYIDGGTPITRLFLAVLLIAVCPASLVMGQTGRPAEGPEFEHLKVLEPLLGSFSQETNGNFEMRRKHIWTDLKRMIVVTLERKPKDSDQDFSDTPYREFFYWNAQDQRIEQVVVNPRAGRTETYVVTPNEDNEFDFELVNTSRAGSISKGTWAVTDEGMTMRGGRTNS
jgi:hypothetical protein